MTLVELLESLLPEGRRLAFGELLLSRLEDGTYEARHRDDAHVDTGLRILATTGDLRELAKFDFSGDYRPLKTAPTLRSGWKTESRFPADFLGLLDAVYPGVFATWIAYEHNELAPVAFRETLERQTGMYRLAGTITDDMAHRILLELCAPGCLRRVLWSISDPVSGHRIERTSDCIPLVCTEACTLAVSRARELAKEARA